MFLRRRAPAVPSGSGRWCSRTRSTPSSASPKSCWGRAPATRSWSPPASTASRDVDLHHHERHGRPCADASASSTAARPTPPPASRPPQRGLDFVRPGGTAHRLPGRQRGPVRRFNDTEAADDVWSRSRLRQRTAPSVAASTYGFGSFLAPSWLDVDRKIPATPTRGGGPVGQGRRGGGLHVVILPPGRRSRPAAGRWPSSGPGSHDRSTTCSWPRTRTSRGIATIAIDPVGHAYGPNSRAGVDLVVAALVDPVRRLRPGLRPERRRRHHRPGGRQHQGSAHQYAEHRACATGCGRRRPTTWRWCGRSAEASTSTATGRPTCARRASPTTPRAWEASTARMVMGADPLSAFGALNVPGGPILDIARLSPASAAGRRSSSANRRAVAAQRGRGGGRRASPSRSPLYLDPPRRTPTRAPIAIQKAGARANWINRSGSPEAFAPLLRKRPPTGHPAKKVLYQYAFGDQTVPNPASATLMRAGGLQDVATLLPQRPDADGEHGPPRLPARPSRPTGRQLGQPRSPSSWSAAAPASSTPTAPGLSSRFPSTRRARSNAATSSGRHPESAHVIG